MEKLRRVRHTNYGAHGSTMSFIASFDLDKF